jgi:hypothetical protein
MKTAKASSDGKQRQRTSLGLLLLGLFVIAIVAAIAIPLYLGFSQMMGGSAPQTTQQFTASTPGSHATIVVEVTSVPSQTLLTGNLLQKNADGTYSRAGKTVSVQWTAKSVVMGSSSEVKVGALIQVSGVLGTTDVLIARQIVVLTDFVKLK